jgi:hypothetical protein
MNQNSNNTIQLKDWMMLSVKGGIVLKYEGRGSVRLVEITRDNNLRTLSLEPEPTLNFSERDAWLIARMIRSMLRDGGTDTWEGNSLLLPISFYGFHIVNLRALAALAYCYHTPQQTLRGDDEEGYLHHVRFDGDCWIVSITNELELEFIRKA